MIDKKKLRSLHNYYESATPVVKEEIASILGCQADDEEAFADYRDALKSEYPHIYGDGIAMVTEIIEQKDLVPEVFYVGENNVMRELEVLRIKGEKIYVQEKVEKDLVQIIVKGKVITVDCIALKKQPPTSVDPLLGVLAEQLLQAADLAR